MQSIPYVLNDNHLPNFISYDLYSQLFYKGDFTNSILQLHGHFQYLLHGPLTIKSQKSNPGLLQFKVMRFLAVQSHVERIEFGKPEDQPYAASNGAKCACGVWEHNWNAQISNYLKVDDG